MKWSVVTLGDVVELQRGYDLPEQERVAGPFPIVGSAGPNGSHYRSNVKAPGVVIGRSGAGFGSAHYCETDFWALNTGLYVKNFRSNHPKFVFYMLDHLDFTKYNSGGAQPSLNRNFIYPIHVQLPKRDEQERIADFLSGWDIAIQKTKQLIAAKERFYDHELSRLVSRGQKPHSHWRTVALSEIANRVQRQSDGGDYPLLTISSASGFIRQEDRYSRYMAGKSAKTYTLLRAGEFSYNKGNSKRYEFGCVFQLQSFDAALVPSVYVSFKLHDSVCASYMRHLFTSDYLKPQLRALVKTGVRNNGLLNIRPDEFMGTKVPLPPFEYQLRIANYLDAASAEIDLLKQRLSAMCIQKRGLMQKLLTGRWRLRVNDSEATKQAKEIIDG